MKLNIILSMLIVFFLTTPVFSEGLQMTGKYNIWRSQEQWEHNNFDFGGGYNGYDDYNAKHPNGEHFYCINGIVQVRTPSGIWMAYSENVYDTPLKCGDRLYNNKVRKWMGLE